MRNILLNYFEFGPLLVLPETSFKNIPNLELWQPLFRPRKNICAILVEGIMKNISVKCFEFGPLLLVQETLFKDNSYLELWQPFFRGENHLCNFGRGHHEVHFCEIILNLDQWFRCCFKTFLI